MRSRSWKPKCDLGHCGGGPKQSGEVRHGRSSTIPCTTIRWGFETSYLYANGIEKLPSSGAGARENNCSGRTSK